MMSSIEVIPTMPAQTNFSVLQVISRIKVGKIFEKKKEPMEKLKNFTKTLNSIEAV